MSASRLTLVCFAVKEEARAFSRRAAGRDDLEALVTGMGRRNTDAAVRSRLRERLPDLVVSSGFAGGLRPDLATGAIVFAADNESELTARLRAAGAHPGQFFCAEQVATTAAQKAALWQATGADAVEMESPVVRAVCREKRIPCVIIRVVLDTATEDLPLDFNQLMGPGQKLDPGKLALRLVKSPLILPALIRLQRRSAFAAQKLAEVLLACLGG